MKLREHRGGYADSMATVVELPATLEAVTEYIRQALGERYSVRDEQVTVVPLAFDDRNGWDTHMIGVEGYGVFGFTDGPISVT